MTQKLLVIGAGPKALSLASKAQVLRSLGFTNVPHVTIIDKRGIAAYWDGGSGFTDGHQHLGTPPEKDVGFPYHSGEWGQYNHDVDDHMLRFSWHRFKVLGDAIEPLFTWVDRGRLQPTHGEWANYLKWVAEQVGPDLLQGEVTEIGITERGKWNLVIRDEKGITKHVEGDGLVITGPGSVKENTSTMDRVFNPVTFWPNVARFQDQGLDFCVAGVGETAGAIVAAAVRRLGLDSRVFVISPHGFIYSRGESLLENRVYSDPSNWDEIAPNHRREFIRRTDRGVFSVAVQGVINASPVPVLCLPGRANLDSLRPSDHGGVRVEVQYEGAVREHEFDYLIDAASVDRLWFWKLMDEASQKSLSTNMTDLVRDRTISSGQADLREQIEQSIDFNLKVRSFKPDLYLPMLASFRRGPGFPNLSCLGTVSDRILKAYVRAPRGKKLS